MVKSKQSRPAGPAVRAILNALEAAHKLAHPAAEIDSYRYNSASIRIRVIDPDFLGISRADRDDQIWEILGKLSEDVQSQITLVLLLTPEETKTSFANMEYDNPTRTRL